MGVYWKEALKRGTFIHKIKKLEINKQNKNVITVKKYIFGQYLQTHYHRSFDELGLVSVCFFDVGSDEFKRMAVQNL